MGPLATMGLVGLGLLLLSGSGGKKKAPSVPGGPATRDDCLTLTAATMATVFAHMSATERMAAVPTLQAGGLVQTAQALQTGADPKQLEQAIATDVRSLNNAKLLELAQALRASFAIPGATQAADCLEALTKV